MADFDEMLKSSGIAYSQKILNMTKEMVSEGGLSSLDVDSDSNLQLTLRFNFNTAGAMLSCKNGESSSLIQKLTEQLIQSHPHINDNKKTEAINYFTQSVKNEVEKMSDLSGENELCSDWKKYADLAIAHTQELLTKI